VAIHNAQPSSTQTPVNPDLSATRFGEEPQLVDRMTPGLSFAVFKEQLLKAQIGTLEQIDTTNELEGVNLVVTLW
jgi:hypothetical protein